MPSPRTRGIWISLAAIVVIYTAMGVAAVTVLRSMARRWRESERSTCPRRTARRQRAAGVDPDRTVRVVNLSDVVAALLFVGVVAYALFGGADFGSGVWDLTAGERRVAGGPLRAQIDRSIGPVWEANHVWLIYVLVFLWTGVPDGVRRRS